MAEVHIVGQITGAKDFPLQNLFCKWTLQCGNNWKIVAVEGKDRRRSALPVFENNCKWCYPIDVHLATTGIQGWPKIYIQVYHLDWLGRCQLFGYGFVTVPTMPGTHTLHCYTWRPFGNVKERFVQYFLGGGPQLKYPDLIFTTDDRYKLNTEAMGVVTFEVNVILRNFYKFGVEYK